ncbi:DUF1524 domain-containing protein [Rhodococcus sp. NPDC003318]|uniref:GmrSD restriction endonuclease domain-containing protein n=1 Tax=Rhodococcus sp. NPDC003318 TaxID=3364503 RepID=UPI0036754692
MRLTRLGTVTASAALAAVSVTLIGCAPPAADVTAADTAEPETVLASDVTSQAWQLTAADVEQATAVLGTLPVKGRAPKTGYTRDEFGPAWTDDVDVALGGNKCPTREDILQRDMTDLVLTDDGKNCTVLSGTLLDPYTATTINFVRGKDTSTAVQIDHAVALSNAWQTGAQQLTERQRRNFANDPRNLIAADGPTNAAKGDGDTASWLPPNKSFRCRYVAMQIDVKATYGLWVTQAEKDAMAEVLRTCDVPAPEPAPAPAQVTYGSCADARAVGAAPLYAGQPGYSRNLDRDGDGVACE